MPQTAEARESSEEPGPTWYIEARVHDEADSDDSLNSCPATARRRGKHKNEVVNERKAKIVRRSRLDGGDDKDRFFLKNDPLRGFEQDRSRSSSREPFCRGRIEVKRFGPHRDLTALEARALKQQTRQHEAAAARVRLAAATAAPAARQREEQVEQEQQPQPQQQQIPLTSETDIEWVYVTCRDMLTRHCGEVTGELLKARLRDLLQLSNVAFYCTDIPINNQIKVKDLWMLMQGVPGAIVQDSLLLRVVEEIRVRKFKARARVDIGATAMYRLADVHWYTILDYVGGHHLGVYCDWLCRQCSPMWYGWWCSECRMSVPPRWTIENHFGQCGQSCGCCRARNPEDGPLSCPECYAVACVSIVDKMCHDAVRRARAAGLAL